LVSCGWAGARGDLSPQRGRRKQTGHHYERKRKGSAVFRLIQDTHGLAGFGGWKLLTGIQIRPV
jgi:hypothetical protein